MPGVCLVPFNLDEAGYGEGLWLRADLGPPAAEQKEETFADLRAIGEKDSSPHEVWTNPRSGAVG
jgi:hypothetical protein